MADENNQEQLVQEDLFPYEDYKIKCTTLLSEWTEEIEETEVRRQERFADIDIEELRQRKEIEEDETFLPELLIHTNILREQPTYLRYLSGSHRMAIFRARTNPDIISTLKIERDFTDGVRYIGWFRDYFRLIDGAQLHGWDSFEVVPDMTKPMHIRMEHIGHDKLIFNFNCIDIQDNKYILRHFRITNQVLEEFTQSYGFDKEQVDLILENDQQRSNNQSLKYDIYKVFIKYDGIIYVGWIELNKTGGWLKKPEPLFLGVEQMQLTDTPAIDDNGLPIINETGQQILNQEELLTPQPTSKFPVFIHLYMDNEEKPITRKVGRGFLDKAKQEGITSLQTTYTNSCARASDVHASPATADEAETELRQLDISVKSGMFWSKPVNFFHMDYPDPEMLRAIQYFRTSNAQDTGALDTAVINRKDSRKTATELQEATAQSEELKQLNLMFFSEFLRSVYTFIWEIVQNRAANNYFPFATEKNQDGSFENPTELIMQEFIIKPAGDIDMLLRDRKIAQMERDWPVYMNTPLATEFLMDLTKLKYQEEGDRYAMILGMGDPRNIILGLLSIIDGFLTPDVLASLPPQQQQMLIQQLETAAKFAGLQQPTGQDERGQNIQNQPQGNTRTQGNQGSPEGGKPSGQNASNP